MEKKAKSLRLEQIRPKGSFSYEVDYKVELLRGYSHAPTVITGKLTVRVGFRLGKRRRHVRIEDIEREAKKEIRELLPNLIEQLPPE